MRPELPAQFLTHPLAHRAYHDVTDGRPENSRAAIRAAIAARYVIEIDVQLSADSAAMVFHDYALDRLTHETGPVRERRAAELARLTLRGGDEGVPDLPEVLDLVAGQVPLLVEIKDQDGAMGDDIGPLEQAVATARTGYAGPVAVMSFNPHSVAEMARLLPSVPRGLVTSAYTPEDWPLSEDTCARLRDIPDFDRIEAGFISHEAADLGRARVAELKSKGARILCWTIKSPAQEAEARKVAEGITFEGYPAAFPG